MTATADTPSRPIPTNPRRTLTNAQIRVLCVGMALAQVATAAPMWRILPTNQAPVFLGLLAGISGLIAIVVATIFARAWVRGGPIGRSDQIAALALVLHPVAIMLMAPIFVVLPEFRPTDSYRSSVFALIVLYGGIAVLHLLPAFLVTLAVYGRKGASDKDWSPHEVYNGDRGSALLGISILTGGWTAVLGSIGLLLVYGGADIDADDLADIGTFAVLAQGFGMVLGLFAGIVSSTIPASTRLDRSVPRIFLPAMATGAIGTAVFPLLGIPAAAITLLITCLVTRRTCRLFPPGHCQRCNYDLTGLADAVCPECGHAAGHAGA